MEGNFGSPQRIETGSACVPRLNSGQLNPVCHLSSEMLVGYVTRCARRGRHSFPDLGERVMRISSSLVAPSALAVLSTVLLSGTAASQTATGSSTSQLPGITVVAPKQVARSVARP